MFWVHIQKGVCIFKTIVEPFESLQSNYSQINVVYIKLNKLENMLSELLPISSLQKNEDKIILDQVKKRKQSGVGPLLAIDSFNPVIQGGTLKSSNLFEGLTFIYEVGHYICYET